MKFSEIPKYLKESELYKILKDEEDKEINVPYFKEDNNFSSIEELDLVIKVYDYWGLDLYEFVFTNKDKINELGKEFENKENKELNFILTTNDNHICEACSNGYLNALKIYHKNKYSWFAYYREMTAYNYTYYTEMTACYYAAKNGHLDCLKYAHENRCPWDNTASLDCLKYAYDNGCPWNKSLLYPDASNNKLTLTYETKYPWDLDICYNAAKLECLIYAYKNECPWDIYKIRLCKTCTYKNRCH